MTKQPLFQFITFVLFFAILTPFATSQTTVYGTISDAKSGDPLMAASILIKGGNTGTITDLEGNFTLTSSKTPPFQLIISYVGYGTQEVNITQVQQRLEIQLEPGTYFGQEIVISASRTAEKVTDASATISVIDAKSINENAAPDPTVLLATTKGVEYNRKGVGVVDFNIRGFNTSFNSRNLLLVDARNANLVAFGLPYMQMTALQKEDIERVEVVLGPSSALYGYSASNGLVNIITKDPRKSPGTTVGIGAGNQSQLNLRLRHAQKVNDKLGFKITGNYLSGTDFMYTDSAYYDANPRDNIFPRLGQGAPEFGLNPDFEYINGSAGVYYKVDKNADLILNYSYARGEFLQTSGIGRIQYDGWNASSLHLRYVSPRWFAQLSNTWNGTANDRSSNISILTDNVESYRTFKNLGLIDFSDSEIASRAENTRLLAVTPNGPLELPVNGRFEDGSSRLAGELQYNNSWQNLRFVGGAQLQRDVGDSRGTYLREKLEYNIIGGYAQLEYRFNNSGFKLVGAARGDHHEIYGFNLAPKGGIMHIGNKGVWRLTYGRGIVSPTILQSEFIFAAGRLQGNSSGYTLWDIDLATGTSTTRDFPALQVEKLDAFEIGYKGDLTENLYFDANAFYNIHTDFIVNAAADIANPGAGTFVIERGGEPISNFQGALFSAGVQFMGSPLEALIESGVLPANASTSVLTFYNFGRVNTYGFDVGLNYKFTNRLTANLNYSYFNNSFDETDLSNDLNNDGKVEEYVDLQINSPEHKFNLALNYSTPDFFANLLARAVSQYNYFAGTTIASETIPNLIYQGTPVIEGQPVAGTFNEGPLGGFVTFDLNAGYRFGKFTVSAGVSNIFDAAVRDFVTSPTMGRLFFIDLKVDLPAVKSK